MVHDTAGIKLSDAKRVFLVSRLLKRLRATSSRSFRDYFKLVARAPTHQGEHQELINAVTTNKTDFFREPEHFRVLLRWLREPSTAVQNARRDGLRIWCAASSTGEEPYTIAAVLREALPAHEYARVSIVASDIDTAVLESVRRGIYSKAAVETVDPSHRMQMFVQGTGKYRDKYRVRRELRERLTIRQQNLMAPHWTVGEKFDIVFCRNVLIYFDRITQQEVVTRLLGRTLDHGLLFLGHAEGLNGLEVSARPVSHAVYAPKREGDHPSALHVPVRAVEPAHQVPAKRTIRKGEVLTVGQTRRGAKGNAIATLDHSLLLMLRCIHINSFVVSHVEVGAGESVRGTIEQLVSEIAGMCRLTKREFSGCRAKLVGAQLDSVNQANDALRKLSIEVTVVKVVPDGTRLEILPNSDRIRLYVPRWPGQRPARLVAKLAPTETGLNDAQR